MQGKKAPPKQRSYTIIVQETVPSGEQVNEVNKYLALKEPQEPQLAASKWKMSFQEDFSLK